MAVSRPSLVLPNLAHSLALPTQGQENHDLAQTLRLALQLPWPVSLLVVLQAGHQLRDQTMKQIQPNSLQTHPMVDWITNRVFKFTQKLRLMIISWPTMMSCPKRPLVRIRISFLSLNITLLIDHLRLVSEGLQHGVLDLVKVNEAKHNH